MKTFVQQLAFATAATFITISAPISPLPTVHAASEQTAVLTQVKQALDTSLPILLPKTVTVKAGKHLTAKTSVSKTGYKVVFYETADKIAVNAAQLDTVSKHVVARIQLKQYRSSSEAQAHIGYENYGTVGGQKVSLGYGIKGYQDAGAGQLYTAWNEGRWALATHTHTDKSEKGVTLAKRAVRYLEHNTLPAPERYGAIRLDAVGRNDYVMLQRQQYVLKVDKVAGMDLLKVTTSIR